MDGGAYGRCLAVCLVGEGLCMVLGAGGGRYGCGCSWVGSSESGGEF